MQPTMDDSQAQRERAFHDALFSAGGKRGNAGEFYDATRISSEWYRAAVLERARNHRVLEIGCGLETLAPALTEYATQITAVDISPVAVACAQRRASELGLDDIRYMEMNAEELAFPDGEFDLVFGASILHHLRLDRTYTGIARVLSDSGSAVFFEPLGHNALINLYRRLTPEQRTKDEHPLLMADLDAAYAHFEQAEIRFYHLTAPAAVLFKRFGLFASALGALERFDAFVLNNVTALRRYAWIVVLTLKRPRRP
jgi:ubiquinone/menaquinone biosynthesis C-methylase UbiE